jgi:hypothetical protein
MIADRKKRDNLLGRIYSIIFWQKERSFACNENLISVSKVFLSLPPLEVTIGPSLIKNTFKSTQHTTNDSNCLLGPSKLFLPLPYKDQLSLLKTFLFKSKK